MDIVIFSLIRHDAPISSTPLALAKVFSKQHRVFYIDHPTSVKDVLNEEGIRGLLKRRWSENNGQIEMHAVHHEGHSFWAIKPWMTVPINSLSPGNLYNRFSWYNDTRMNRFLSALYDQQEVKDQVFINAMDPWFFRRFFKRNNPLRRVYYTLDDISEVGYTAKHGVALEREKCLVSDYVFATSTELVKLMQANRDEVYLLPNAVDFDLFHKATDPSLKRPKEFEGIDKPIIAYVGHLDYRVDPEIMFAILRNHPDKYLVVVGPETWPKEDFEKLMSFKNFLFVGPKKIEQLPDYLAFTSVGIIPFLLTKVTKSIYPLKVNEYLAAGVPVVATPFSGDMELFSDLVPLTIDSTEFCDFIQQEIDLDSPEKKEKRYTRALENTWTKRVKEFWSVLGL